MKNCQCLTFFDIISDFLFQLQTYRKIDHTILRLSSSAKDQRADSDFITLDMRNIAALRRWYCNLHGCRRQLLRMIYFLCRTALCLNKCFQFFQGISILDGLPQQCFRRSDIFCLSTCNQHPASECQHKLREIFRSAAVQSCNCFFYFQCISDGITKRLIHIGDQCMHLTPCIFADRHHLFCQSKRIFFAFHKSSASDLDIQNDRIGTGSQFLTHDRAGDQRKIVHGRRHIPQGIEFFVCRSQICRLSHDRNTDRVDILNKCFHRDCCRKT